MKKVLLTLAALLSTTAFVNADLTPPTAETSSIVVPGPGADIPNSSHSRKHKKMTKEQAEEAIKKHLDAAKKDAESIKGADHKALAENLVAHIQGNLETLAKLTQADSAHFNGLASGSKWCHDKVKGFVHDDKKAEKKAEHDAKNVTKKEDVKHGEKKSEHPHDKKHDDKAKDGDMKHDDKAKDGDKKDGDKKHDDKAKDGDMKHDDKAKEGDKKDGDMKHDDKAKEGDKKEEKK